MSSNIGMAKDLPRPHSELRKRLDAGARAASVFARRGRRPTESFAIRVDLGGAGSDEVQALLHALSEVNRAAGGQRLLFRLDDENPLLVRAEPFAKFVKGS